MAFNLFDVDGYAALAPMAGVADRAMREIAVEFGAAYTVTELISAKGITLGDRKSKELLSVSDEERPVGIQLFGSEPEIMATAVKEAEKRAPQFIDINMGCPAPKVISGGSGSALLKNPELAEKVAKAAVKATSLPVTAKIRTGWDKNSKNATEIAKRLESVGISAITVHGRTRDMMYSPPVDIEAIAEVKRAVKIPVIANGDITSPKDAAEMYENTGCDFIMVGRAAMGAPWIFSMINAYLRDGTVIPEPPFSEKMVIMLRQIDKMRKYKPERVAILEARKYTAWYMKGLHGAAMLRRKCAEINSFDDVVEIAKLSMEVYNKNTL